MMKYYCDCWNICVQVRENTDRLDEYSLSDEEKQNFFFQQSPLIILKRCLISEEHSVFIQLSAIGSWIVHKCTYCSTYTHATKSDESTAVVFLNGSLEKLSDQETELMRKSSEFSPIFRIPTPGYWHLGTCHSINEASSDVSASGLLTRELEKTDEERNFSLDSEGIFLFDEMEMNTTGDDEDDLEALNVSDLSGSDSDGDFVDSDDSNDFLFI